MAIAVAFQASMSSFSHATVAWAMLLDTFALCHCGCKLFASLFLVVNCGNTALLI